MAVVVTLENDDPRLVFEPDVCSPTPAAPCSATWRVLALAGASSGSVTSTSGPVPADLSLLPQLFLSLRGSALTLRTSSASNATANVTLTAQTSGTTLATSFDSAAGALSAVNLPPDEDMTLALTYVAPGRLDVDSIAITAASANATSLSPVPGPSTSVLPSFVTGANPTATTSAAASSRHHHLAQPVGTIVGETLAGFFGLILLAAASTYAVLAFRRRRRRLSRARAPRPLSPSSPLPPPQRRPSVLPFPYLPPPTPPPPLGVFSSLHPHTQMMPSSTEVMNVEMDDLSTSGPRAI